MMFLVAFGLGFYLGVLCICLMAIAGRSDNVNDVTLKLLGGNNG